MSGKIDRDGQEVFVLRHASGATAEIYYFGRELLPHCLLEGGLRQRRRVGCKAGCGGGVG